MLLARGQATTNDAALVLEECSGAIATGDGRELWKLQPNGQLVNVAGGKCAGIQSHNVSDGGRVVLMDCDAAAKISDGHSQWEVLGNGQMGLAQPGGFCMSQSGPAPGRTNVAAKAAATASSAASAQHGANLLQSHVHGTTNGFHGAGAAMAVDSNEATYWASKLDTKEPVTLTVDLGGKTSIQDIRIDWEFPAKSFIVSVSLDGKHFVDAYSTDVNVLKASRVPIGRAASAVRIVMREPHAAIGPLEGHSLYGIASVSVFANQLETIVQKCTTAAKSSDARDKFFISRTSEFDSASGRALEKELMTLEVSM